jgi:RimJ/RimL family protein N-acetyltransferase
MAGFPSREETAFLAHWTKILGDDAIAKKTILVDGQVAGNIVSFEQSGERQVGYWLGKEFWGKGIATRVLAVFLELVDVRPLLAYVARHNVASRRVLEKCGFILLREEGDEVVYEIK